MFSASMVVDDKATNPVQTPHSGAAVARLPMVDGVYRTAPRRVGMFARTFPSTAFYARFFGIVWRASRLARRGDYDALAWTRSSHEVLHALERVGVQLEIAGVEHLDQLDTPFLVVGNHVSTLETAILPGVIQPIRDVTFVVKKALVEMPVFRHVMRSRDPVIVSQTNAREDLKTMLTEGSERLQRGISVVVFPEGRRSPTFDVAEFNTIGVKLAHRNSVPIVPLALKTDAWALGWPISDVGRIAPQKKVHFEFGQPLWVNGRGADANRAIIEFIQTKLQQWQSDDS